MDSVTLLWILTLLGAAGFAATGYWYGRLKVEEEVAAAEERARASASVGVHEAKTVPPPLVTETLEPPPQTSESLAKATEEARAEYAEQIDAATKAADEERAAADDAMRQLAAIREELRVEILARTDAEKRTQDLTSRLVSASQQVSALRAKACLTPDAPAVRGGSLTPPAPRVSMPPSMSSGRMQSLAPGLFGELEDLRREVARLKRENETLRVAAFVKRSE